jgi:hypothetical protein
MEFQTTLHAIMAGKDVDLLTDTVVNLIQGQRRGEAEGPGNPWGPDGFPGLSEALANKVPFGLCASNHCASQPIKLAWQAIEYGQ